MNKFINKKKNKLKKLINHPKTDCNQLNNLYQKIKKNKVF